MSSRKNTLDAIPKVRKQNLGRERKFILQQIEVFGELMGVAYTFAGNQDVWILSFEEAQTKVSYCGPEKYARFILVEEYE